MLAAPALSEEAKGRIVAKTLVPGVMLNEVAHRRGVTATPLSSWRRLARQGKLVVPEVAGAEFDGLAPTAQPVDELS